ncbi:MAG: Gfo/Idh/MocA family oxidoreductase, partial [Pedobacter sp.]
MDTKRPILIVGSGSIGRRHLQNLQALGCKNFIFYRTGKSKLPDEMADIPVEYELGKALARKPIAMIVANPTSLHMAAALAAAEAGTHIFLEKPISHNLDGVEKLKHLVKKKGLVLQVGFHFRYHPGLKHVKRLLEENTIGRVVSTQAHWGEYLPDWHPGEDYREGYSAKAVLGGGVLLTLSHPFDYLRWLIGEVSSVSAIMGSNGGLGIEVEDSADVLLNFKSGAIGNVHIDYIQRPAEHNMRIIGQTGVILWDSSSGLVKWFAEGKWEEKTVPEGFERNRLFIDEMRHFLSCITTNAQSLCTIDDGIKALR